LGRKTHYLSEKEQTLTLPQASPQLQWGREKRNITKLASKKKGRKKDKFQGRKITCIEEILHECLKTVVRFAGKERGIILEARGIIKKNLKGSSEKRSIPSS